MTSGEGLTARIGPCKHARTQRKRERWQCEEALRQAPGERTRCTWQAGSEATGLHGRPAQPSQKPRACGASCLHRTTRQCPLRELLGVGHKDLETFAVAPRRGAASTTRRALTPRCAAAAGRKPPPGGATCLGSPGRVREWNRRSYRDILRKSRYDGGLLHA